MCDVILGVRGREILDSRGDPTVEAELTTEAGVFRASVPSGASAGTFEALEKRDGGKRYRGKGVLKAVHGINTKIAETLKGTSVVDQREVDKKLVEIDGSENKANLGANALLAVSIAVAKAGAKAQGMPLYVYLAHLADAKGITLPIPQMNVINGGRHAGIEDDIQEHLIMPIGSTSFKDALEMSCDVYHTLRDIIKAKYGSIGIHLGDEGGFVPPIEDVKERLELISEAIERTAHVGKVAIAIDCAASEFYRNGAYHIRDSVFTAAELVSLYETLVDAYGIVSIEDGMHEEDWEGWQLMANKLGNRIQIVGDDLFVTNTKRIQRGLEEASANSIILKVNQIGTVSESIDAGKLAMQKGWTVVVAHRSGETEDTFIADLVVGMDAGQSKFGAPARTDRNAKYNQLLRIEEELADKAVYADFPYQP
jgi:enolase